MPDKVIINNQAVPIENTKVVFGNIQGPTPQWMTWAFRGTIVFTTAISAWIAATNLISEDIKFELILILKFVDTGVWGVGKLFGLKKDE